MDAHFMLRLGMALAVIALNVLVAVRHFPRASRWRKIGRVTHITVLTLWLGLLLLVSTDPTGATSAGPLVFPFFARVLFWISVTSAGLVLLVEAFWRSSEGDAE
jgi:hypothetical protein